MQPGIPTAAQTFPSSQTEIADPTSVDGGAGTSNKGMLLHRREPRNVGPRKKSRLETGGDPGIGQRPPTIERSFALPGGGQGWGKRGRKIVFESRMKSWNWWLDESRYLTWRVEIKSVYQGSRIYIYVPTTRREKEIDRSMIYGDDYGEEKKLREDNNSS